MRLHLIGLFHTIPSAEFSHCAFTGRVVRFGKMMAPFGYEVIEYSNEGSESEATKHVTILGSERFRKLKELYKKEQPKEAASTDSTIYREFSSILRRAMASNVEPGDIICHPFGIAHADLVNVFPDCKHVEIGIGYVQAFADFRVYETYQWWSWHQGKEQKPGNAYQWVCPMGYDIDDWEPNLEPGKYLLYFGRVIDCKGLQIVKEIARRVDFEVKVVGGGEEDFIAQYMSDAPSNLTYSPPVTGKNRSELLRNAYAMLMPTLYCEPFGGAGVEGMLCGTPLIASDFGAFCETVKHGLDGYRCKTLGDWLHAIENVENLDREIISMRARSKYGLFNVGWQMDRIFKQIANLSDQGWYSLEPIDAVWRG